MKITIYGLWHLGSVTAACLASCQHEVWGVDEDEATIQSLQKGQAPIAEPGLDALIQEGLHAGRLHFSSDSTLIFQSSDVLWITFDTPVDQNDVADTEIVLTRIEQALFGLPSGALIIVSSQLPVLSIQRLQKLAQDQLSHKQLRFACIPENLRLGKALQVFLQPDRYIVGVDSSQSQEQILEILKPITEHLLFMSIKSAEMTKHAINSFLALSVVFANELASICEWVGADAKEVEQGLKSEKRIGPQAYVSPGTAFAGGTLARDVTALNQLSQQYQLKNPIFHAIQESNSHHKQWVVRKLTSIFGSLQGKVIGVFGLTYKPDTNTLRRSSSIEACQFLSTQQASIHAYDPAIQELPGDLSFIQLFQNPYEVLRGADAFVILTSWDAFRTLEPERLIEGMKQKIIVDPNQFLFKLFHEMPSVQYYTIGRNA